MSLIGPKADRGNDHTMSKYPTIQHVEVAIEGYPGR